MILGLIGLANSGKTSIFNALTRSEAAVTAYANAKVEPNLAVVEVKDERVLRLVEMYQPKKTAFASVDFIDFVGLSEGAAKEGAFSGLTMGLIKNTDALGLVIRNFDDGLMGTPDPLGDLEQLETELFLSDLLIAEKRVEKIHQGYRRGIKDPTVEGEEKLLQRIIEALGEGQPLRDLGLSKDEIKAVRSFHFLTLKPALVVLNSDEERFGKNAEILAAMEKKYRSIEFAGLFEMELSRLEDEEEAKMFMEDLGISESARDRLVGFAYDTVGYISFFTVGPDEVRAWNLIKGQSAVEAAGTIHNDLARGFIRAECFTYDDLMTAGSEKGVKENGKLRLEGKTYSVQDGDILNIRFSV